MGAFLNCNLELIYPVQLLARIFVLLCVVRRSIRALRAFGIAPNLYLHAPNITRALAVIDMFFFFQFIRYRAFPFGVFFKPQSSKKIISVRFGVCLHAL